MINYGFHCSLSINIPSQYRELRKAAYACTKAQDESELSLINELCKKLSLSLKVAVELLADYWMLDDDIFSIGRGGDPARGYDRFIHRTLPL